MSEIQEYEKQVKTAKKALDAAKTAEDIRKIWKDNNNLGHRTLGKLLTGSTSVEKIVEKKAAMVGGD